MPELGEVGEPEVGLEPEPEGFVELGGVLVVPLESLEVGDEAGSAGFGRS